MFVFAGVMRTINIMETPRTELASVSFFSMYGMPFFYRRDHSNVVSSVLRQYDLTFR